jgi:hypothetical protein
VERKSEFAAIEASREQAFARYERMYAVLPPFKGTSDRTAGDGGSEDYRPRESFGNSLLQARCDSVEKRLVRDSGRRVLGKNNWTQIVWEVVPEEERSTDPLPLSYVDAMRRLVEFDELLVDLTD